MWHPSQDINKAAYIVNHLTLSNPKNANELFYDEPKLSNVLEVCHESNLHSKWATTHKMMYLRALGRAGGGTVAEIFILYYDFELPTTFISLNGTARYEHKRLQQVQYLSSHSLVKAINYKLTVCERSRLQSNSIIRVDTVSPVLRWATLLISFTPSKVNVD